MTRVREWESRALRTGSDRGARASVSGQRAECGRRQGPRLRSRIPARRDRTPGRCPHHRPRQARSLRLPQRLRSRLRRAQARQARAPAGKGRDQPRRAARLSATQFDGVRGDRGGPLRQLGPHRHAADDAPQRPDRRPRLVPWHRRDVPDLEPRAAAQGPAHSRGFEGHHTLPARRAGSFAMTSTGSQHAPHVPVLVDEVIAALAIERGATIVDGTFGAGGYTRAMLGAGAGRVIGFDRDPDAIEQGRSLVPDPRLTLINERFSQMDRALAERGIEQVDAIALDIGVSSMQLDRADRGFSFSADGPLDMRMSKSGLTAAEYLNAADEAEIARILKDYGEEPRARAIARAIVAARPGERTAEPAAIGRRAAGFRPGQKSDPAKIGRAHV